MNLQFLQELYAKHPLVFANGADKFLSNQYISFQNIYGSCLAFVINNVLQHTTYNHLIITNTKDEAAYLHNDIENISGALDICFYPDSYKKTGVFKELNASHLTLRGEALGKFSTKYELPKKNTDEDIAQVVDEQDNTTHQARKKILVTYPEAIFEKVINEKKLNENTLPFKVGAEIDLTFIAEFLVVLGFTKEDFVQEPGQFAIRGGILDIYSYGNDKPYRIELFGNEIDSIRIIDPETQLSERKLLQVTIVPNVETATTTHEKVSLLDFLPSNTIVWIKNLGFTTDRLLQLHKSLQNDMAITQVGEDYENHVIKTLAAEDFEYIPTWLQKLKQRKVIEWQGNSLLNTLQVQQSAITTYTFNTKEQPSFNRNFELLIKNLQSHQADKYQLFVSSENPHQLERLRKIFEDLKAEINFTPLPIGLAQGFIDNSSKVVCYTDHQIFQRYHKYRIKQAFSRGKALTMRLLKELVPGDYVVHIDHGVGVYSGLQKIEVNGTLQEAIRIFYKDNDVLYVNINSLHKITKFTGKEGAPPKVHKLGSDVWEKTKAKTKKQVKEIAINLIELYAARKSNPGFAHSVDTYLQTELEASFMYEDTPDQSKATADVKKDMESAMPMDRLVCGDVGFGKTEVAIRSAFKSVVDGKQAAILVPTTILAYQHYQSFKERLKDFPCTVDYINRFKTTKQKKETYKLLEEGKIDILIGTHGILGKDVKFKDLGLLVIDEEQKFGVAAKEKIRALKHTVDTLTLTATPIPRTLQFSLMGARDLSIINTPPPNRQPVTTEVQVFNEFFIRDAIYHETERGGQVFFIHNRIQGLPEMKAYLQKLCPDLNIHFAHGQMPGDELEESIMDFMAHKYDVLLCTNIVESGVDIPNVNTIIINNAHQFGLSDLHQLRGRVGRSNKKAFCYLVAPPLSLLPNDSRKRLQTLEQFSELGSGFQIAMRDLDIRGAGNMLGGEQSGFINDIGFEMYQKILNEAVRELKHTTFKNVFANQLQEKKEYVTDCVVDTDEEIRIPEEYVENINERLSLYTQLDDCNNEEELQAFIIKLTDRFGKPPIQVHKLMDALRCRWVAVKLGFERLIYKNDILKLYFIANPESSYFESDTFTNILHHVQKSLKQANVKNVGKQLMLTVSNVKNLQEVKWNLDRLAAEK
jgi:transcription-repair coupling factor (superfamily II helicase)